MTHTISLSPSEIEQAEQKASEHGERQGFGNNFRGANDSGMTNEGSHKMWRLGMLSEVAVAKSLGVEWTGDIGQDVGCYQVKSSYWPSGRLCVSTTTRLQHLHPDQIYILCTPTNADWNQFSIRGWAKVSDFMLDEYLDDMNSPERPLQWALPNDRLRDVATLPTDKEVDWVTPTGSRQRHRLLGERNSGYYERVYRERKNQNVIAILTRTGQTVKQALALTGY